MPTVLVVDDDVDHRELMTLALHRDGHEVVTAADAATAFGLLTAGGIDAVLLDVRMPGESGVDLCRRLRAEAATAVVPVLMVSADVSDHRILEALHAGADDFLAKPFHRAQLCARLGDLLPAHHRPTVKASAAALPAVRYAVPRPATSLTHAAGHIA